MKHPFLKSLSAIAAAAVLAPNASAQLDPAFETTAPLYLNAGQFGEVNLNDGDVVVYKNAKYKVQDGKLVPTVAGAGPVPMGSEVTTEKGQKGKLQRHYLGVGYYPLAVFSTGGSLINSNHALVPGTFTDNGSVFALNATFALDHNRQFELGGFYFLPYGGGNDLYQLDAKYMLNRNFGVQVAYINSANVDAESTSYFLIMRTQGSLGNPRKNDLGLEVGIGAVNDLTGQFNFTNSEFVPENSINFSAFLTLSYTLAKNVKILASDWYIRDRSDDVTRLGIGVSVSF